jgi:hypothetical protein
MSRKKRAPKPEKKARPSRPTAVNSALFIPLNDEITDRHVIIPLGGPTDEVQATEAFKAEEYLASLPPSRPPAPPEEEVDAQAVTRVEIPSPALFKSRSPKK